MRLSGFKLLLLLLMSAIGIAAAATILITYYELKQSPPLCSSGTLGGISLDCNAVLGSQYSQLLGVPLEFFAVAYFVVNVLLVCLIAFGSEKVFEWALNLLFGWRFLGLIFVPYLVFVEVVIIRAVCLYCTIMHAAIVADFVVITYYLFYKRSFPYTGGESALT